MQEEERALPDTRDRDTVIYGGAVGPRLTQDEMERASDENLLRLFNELPDDTEWRNPKLDWAEGFNRAGGAIQLSQQFGELAKRAPIRVAHLVPDLQAGRHERYAGAALVGLAETDLPTTELVGLIDELDNRGFSSGHFREAAASALQKRAVQDNGLPDPVLSRLKAWLAVHDEPVWPPERKNQEQPEREGHPVLFGLGGMFMLPPGRGYIIRAIAAGYSAKQPPDVEGWTQVIEERLGQEHNPNVWADTLTRMPVLFRGDPGRATELYDAVIQDNPAVLEHVLVLRSLADNLREFRSIEVVRGWLDKLLACSAVFCHQAYGEFLFWYHCSHPDEWSEHSISRQLADASDVAVLRGLAFAASYLWKAVPFRQQATRVLCKLATSEDQSVQQAVARVFSPTTQAFTLDSSMHEIIEAVRGNRGLLLRAAPDLVKNLAPFTGVEPEIVSRVCRDVVRFGSEQIGDIRFSLVRLAEVLTTVALTLHRQLVHREEGLYLFEELISLNVREARLALDMIDRRPFRR